MSLALRTVDADTGIATITVNCPEVLNALDVPTARAICEAVLPLREMPDVRCVVLRGAGRAFIAGADLAAQLEAEREAFAAGTRSADFREGVSAFLAKRPAKFAGH